MRSLKGPRHRPQSDIAPDKDMGGLHNDTVSSQEAKRIQGHLIKKTRGMDGAPVIVLDRAMLSQLPKPLPDSVRPDPEIMMGDEGGTCYGKERS
ncbi:MAG: hypothetical protein AAB512_04910 [Patescibacteria group bacterium]